MGDFFPELKNREELILKTLRSEEESFNKTLDRGIELFTKEIKGMKPEEEVSGAFAFKLYDTYGFPLDLTDLMAREAGLKVCKEDFQNEMKSQQERARKAHKSVEIQVSKADEFAESTKFLGYKLSNLSNSSATCMDCISQGDTIYLIFDQSPFYAEMGGQVADTGTIEINGEKLIVTNVLKDSSGRFLHELNSSPKSNLLSRAKCHFKGGLGKKDGNSEAPHRNTHFTLGFKGSTG